LILGCKVAGKFDPAVAVNFDPPEPKSYPVWEKAKDSGQEGGHDERQTDKRSPNDAARRLADTGYLPESGDIAQHSSEDIARQGSAI